MPDTLRPIQTTTTKPIKHKYGAMRCDYEGKRFPSKLERDCYIRLRKMQELGRIRFFLRQVPFDLPGGVKHIVDFQVFTQDSVIFIEAKGRDLAVGKLKREQVEDLYQLRIYVAFMPSQVDSIVASA